MDVDPFELERWFAEYEHNADVMLAESGVRSLPAERFDTDPGDLGYVIPTDGAPDVRETIAAEYGRSADEVLCTVGTQEANFLAFQSLLSPGDHVVVVTPTYQSLHAVPDSICDVTRVPPPPPPPATRDRARGREQPEQPHGTGAPRVGAARALRGRRRQRRVPAR